MEAEAKRRRRPAAVGWQATGCGSQSRISIETSVEAMRLTHIFWLQIEAVIINRVVRVILELALHALDVVRTECAGFFVRHLQADVSSGERLSRI